MSEIEAEKIAEALQRVDNSSWGKFSVDSSARNTGKTPKFMTFENQQDENLVGEIWIQNNFPEIYYGNPQHITIENYGMISVRVKWPSEKFYRDYESCVAAGELKVGLVVDVRDQIEKGIKSMNLSAVDLSKEEFKVPEVHPDILENRKNSAKIAALLEGEW